MTHEDAGHYAAKHPEGTIEPEIKRKIIERAINGRISCAAAHAIAGEQQCSPTIVGMNIDLLEMRIHKCQLGLFGHKKENKKSVDASIDVDQNLEKALRNLTSENRISCENAWRVALTMDRTKMEVAAACEGLGIKIKPCQLGAF